MTIGAMWKSLRAGPPDLGPARLPGLLQAGMIFSTFFGTFWLMFLPLAAFDVGKYSINARAVSGPYFLTHAGPFIVTFALLLLAIAFGIRTGRIWVREAIPAFWALLFLSVTIVEFGSPHGTDPAGLIQFLIIAGVAAWYLYGKANVTEYYHALARRSAEGIQNPGAGENVARSGSQAG